MTLDVLPSDVRIVTFSNSGTTSLKQKIDAISSVKLPDKAKVIKVIITPDAALTVMDKYGNSGEAPIAQNASKTFEGIGIDELLLVKGTANIVVEVYYKQW